LCRVVQENKGKSKERKRVKKESQKKDDRTGSSRKGRVVGNWGGGLRPQRRKKRSLPERGEKKKRTFGRGCRVGVPGFKRENDAGGGCLGGEEGQKGEPWLGRIRAGVSFKTYGGAGERKKSAPKGNRNHWC